MDVAVCSEYQQTFGITNICHKKKRAGGAYAGFYCQMASRGLIH